ncbi:MAG: hypothetical protein IKG56_04705 [Clostridia bacterium]|nr:hypothetical protein [Clostridia bacterium]
MTIKQRIFNNAVERIISNIPENLTDLEKARYIYVSLGKLFCFEEKFLFGKAKTEDHIYRKALSSSPSFADLKDGRKKKAVCINISRMYSAILREIGIKARSGRDDLEDKHEDTFFEIDGVTYKADLTNDIKFIQLNLPTRHFAVTGSSALTSEDLKEIDSHIGYSYFGEQLINATMEELSSELEHEDMLGNKVSRILEATSNIPGIQNLEFVERDSFYDFMFKRLLSKNDKPRFHKNVLYTQDGDDRNNFHILYTTHDFDKKTQKNKFRRFIFSNAHNRFIEISDEELLSIIDKNHFRTHYAKRIPGLHPRKRKDKDK